MKKINCCVGKKIRLLRYSEGLTTYMLANKLGVSQQQLSRYERGVNKIDVSVIYRLSRIFNVGIDIFFRDISDEKTNAAEEYDLNDSGVLTFPATLSERACCKNRVDDEH